MRSTLDCHALVVGIDNYHSGITPLQSAAHDAEAVSRLLASAHGYQVRCLINAEATATAILDALEQATRTLPEECGFLFYFAGHGVALGDGSEGPQGFLLAQDALPTDDASWLPMDAVRQALETLSCRHLLVVLDCCFAGSFRWSSSRDAMLVSHPLYDSQFARYLDGLAWQALTSASHDQRAADTLPGRRNTRDNSAGGDHSPFASALLRGLSGSADSARAQHPPDGVITATELYQYLFDELAPANAPARQTPGLWPLRPGNAGEFVFLNPQVALNTIPDPPLDDQNDPWLGLRAYGAADANLFFGRRRVVDALVARAAEPTLSLLVVVGASGTGKSSVVKAGLIPALSTPALELDADNLMVETAARWQFTQVPRLRADPSVQLKQALAAMPTTTGAGRQLLLIDQFEELYTQCSDPALRQLFLQELRAQIDRPDGPLVVLTLRSDFEPRLASNEQFSTLLPTARFLVPTFSTEEMRQVIEAPLSAKAMYFDPPEMIDRLLDEVAAMPGALPLLSFALSEMYRQAQRRRRKTGSADRALNEDDYRDTGGVVGALHRRATALYDEAEPALQLTIRRVFLRMVLLEGPRTTRRRVNLGELEFPDPAEQTRVNRVLDDYVGARLLIVDEQYIEPAHDTLVVAWDLLQEWLAASTGQALMRSLWRAARDWDVAARPSGLLWNDDPRLPQVKSMSAELNTLEQRFVRASARRKTIRRSLLQLTTLAVIGLLSYATLYSMDRADEALMQTRVAEEQLANAQRSEGLALLASSRQLLGDGEYFGAAANAARAIGYRHFGVAVDVGPVAGTKENANPVAGADENADSDTVPVRLLGPAQPEYVDAVTVLTQANLGTLRPVAWRPLDRSTVASDANVLVGGNGKDSIEVRDFDAERVTLLPTPKASLQLLALSPDGHQLVALFDTADEPQRLILWRSDGDWEQANSESLELPLDLPIDAMTFSFNGQRLAVGMGRNIVVWDTKQKPIAQPQWLDVSMPNVPDKRTSLAFTTDGNALLVGGWHNQIMHYALSPAGPIGVSTKPLKPKGRALGPEWNLWPEHLQKGDYVNAIEVSRRGDFVAIASANQVLLASIEGDQLNFTNLPDYQEALEIHGFALSADGQLLALENADEVHLLHVPSLVPAGILLPSTFRASQIASLRFFDDDRMLLLEGPGQVEMVDVSGIGERDFTRESSTGLPVIGGGDRLRQMISAGRLDPILLAFPDSEIRPDKLSWKLDDSEDGLVVSFSEPQPGEESADMGSIELVLQSGSERLVAVGISKFEVRKLHGSDFAAIGLFNAADQSLVFRYLLDAEDWGIDRLRFSDNGDRLLATTSNFDGFTQASYAFPTAQPDLWIYLDETMCQAPINLPADRLLAKTALLDCEPEADLAVEPTTD